MPLKETRRTRMIERLCRKSGLRPSIKFLETIGDSGMIYTDLLNQPDLLKIYKDINVVAYEVHKGIGQKMITTEKVWTAEEGDDYKIMLTEYGKNWIKDQNKKQRRLENPQI